MNNAQWLNSRKVVERIIITGQLVLDTPAHFGNGDSGGLTDIALARDALDGRPLLTGASIAGALRNYLREYQRGFNQAEDHDGASLAEQLFGHLHVQNEASVQSWLMIDDALGEAVETELREGVAIDPATRTAEDKKKYDIELLAAGTTFPLRFELWLPKTRLEDDKHKNLLNALVTALRGLENREIGLGTRKRRGLGQCHVNGESWRTIRYDMTQTEGLLAWLREDVRQAQPGLPAVDPPCADVRQEWRLSATLGLAGSLLIRAEGDDADSPDMAHLRSKRRKNEKPVPIVSGTSLAGVVRGRALRIANTMLGRERGRELVDEMFGRKIDNEIAKLPPDDEGRQPTGSRVVARETEIKGGLKNRVQSRVKIDHLTGGAYPGGLFSQQPLWNVKANPAAIHIDMRLRRPGQLTKPEQELNFQAQLGLLLLVLKDLWTSDLPLGGESSVGRGRLVGGEATIVYGNRTWKLQGADEVTVSGDGPTVQLEKWVQAFVASADEETARQWIENYTTEQAAFNAGGAA